MILCRIVRFGISIISGFGFKAVKSIMAKGTMIKIKNPASSTPVINFPNISFFITAP
jgi:hypothetical protein